MNYFPSKRNPAHNLLAKRPSMFAPLPPPPLSRRSHIADMLTSEPRRNGKSCRCVGGGGRVSERRPAPSLLTSSRQTPKFRAAVVTPPRSGMRFCSRRTDADRLRRMLGTGGAKPQARSSGTLSFPWKSIFHLSAKGMTCGDDDFDFLSQLKLKSRLVIQCSFCLVRGRRARCIRGEGGGARGRVRACG